MFQRYWRFIAGAIAIALVVTVAAFHGPLDGVGAVLLVTPCIVALLLVIDSGRRGAFFAAGLLALLAALYAWSQLRPGVDHPPLVEWGIACGAFGAVLCAVAIKVVRPPGAETLVAVLLLGISPMVACCLAGRTYMAYEPYDHQLPEALLETHAEVREVQPLPSGVSLVGADCFNLGAHGKCNDVFIMASTEGASREQFVVRLAEHYSKLGWPLERAEMVGGKSFGYFGCRPMRGILTWDSHCMEIYADPYYEPYYGHPEIPGTVNVYVV